MFFCSLAVYIIGCFVLYKIVDYLIRIPRVANDPNRYILVTGCDTGFGNLIAKRLDQLGCHVFAGCLTEKGETELKKACSERLHAISLDVTSRESVRNALEYVTAKLPQGKGSYSIYNRKIFLNWLSNSTHIQEYIVLNHSPDRLFQCGLSLRPKMDFWPDRL